MEKQGRITLEQVIKGYLEKEANGQNEKINTYLQDKISKDINEEVIEVYSKQIIEQVSKQIEQEEHIKKITQLKVMVLETLLLGIFVGLLVNQFTDGISYTKGTPGINTSGTIIWCVILLVIIILLGCVMYWNKLEEVIFNKSNRNDRVKEIQKIVEPIVQDKQMSLEQ